MITGLMLREPNSLRFKFEERTAVGGNRDQASLLKVSSNREMSKTKLLSGGGRYRNASCHHKESCRNKKETFSVAAPAEPRGEKKLFFVQMLGGEKLLKFVEKCR